MDPKTPLKFAAPMDPDGASNVPLDDKSPCRGGANKATIRVKFDSFHVKTHNFEKVPYSDGNEKVYMFAGLRCTYRLSESLDVTHVPVADGTAEPRRSLIR